MVPEPIENDHVQGPIGLPVSAAVEAVVAGPAGEGLDRADTAQPASAASEPIRSELSPAVISSWAVVSGPNPGRLRMLGASWRVNRSRS
jgi:hypothetical protein